MEEGGTLIGDDWGSDNQPFLQMGLRGRTGVSCCQLQCSEDRPALLFPQPGGGLRSWLTQVPGVLSSECSPSPHPVPHPDPGLAVQNHAQGRVSRETFASASWVFIPASQCHRHRHLRKGVLGAGVPSCSDKTKKSSQPSLVPAPERLPAYAR